MTVRQTPFDFEIDFGDNVPIYIRSDNILGFIHIDNTNGSDILRIVFIDRTVGDLLERTLIDNYTSISFRFGFLPYSMSPWKKFNLVYYNINNTYKDSIVTIECLDPLVQLNYNTRTKSFKNKSVSGVLSEIMESYSFDEISIRDTKGVFSRNQYNVSDGYFLINELLPNASTKDDGRTDFHFWVEDGKRFIFDVVDWVKPIKKVYGEDYEDVDSFEVSWNGSVLSTLGGSVLKSLGYDPFSKNVLEYTIQDSNYSVPTKDDKSFVVPSQGNNTTRNIVSSFNTIEKVTKNVESLFSRLANYRYSAIIKTMRGDSTVRAGDLIKYITKDDNDNVKNSSGVYLVDKVISFLEGNSFNTHIYIHRRGSGIGNIENLKVQRRESFTTNNFVTVPLRNTGE